jgi:chaperone modulatory protein CbpM
MMRLTAVVALFANVPGGELTQPELIAWVERGWVRPEAGGDDPIFHDIDIARVRLIHDLRSVMRVEDETIPIILSLLDQVYDLRAGLRVLLRAVEAQPDPVKQAILAAID